jgi:hypothetical protein
MHDIFVETKFYFVKTDDNKYSLFNIATDKLILADVDKSEIDDFLKNNNPSHPSQPADTFGGLGRSILSPLVYPTPFPTYHPLSIPVSYNVTSPSAVVELLEPDSSGSVWSDIVDSRDIWFYYV